MTSSTPAMLHFILNSVPRRRQVDPNGEVTYEADPRYLLYRMLDIDADNVVAFVAAAHACEDLVASYKGHLPSRLWRQLMTDVKAEVESSIISLTAASGQHAHLMTLLLRDVSESYHYMAQGGAGKKEGLAARLRGMQGAKSDGDGAPPPDRTGGAPPPPRRD